LSDQDQDERKWKTNTGFAPHPPGLGGGSRNAPTGSVGTSPNNQQRESDYVMGPVWIQDGDQLKGPYHLLRHDPLEHADDHQTGRQNQQPAQEDNRGKTHFHDTGDENVNRHYQERGEVMLPNPDLEEKDATLEAEAKVDRAHAVARGERSGSGQSDEGGHGREGSTSYEFNERTHGRGR